MRSQTRLICLSITAGLILLATAASAGTSTAGTTPPGPVSWNVAQTDLTAPAPSLRIERIGRNQGLSDSDVYGIVQDRSGLIWIGTENGLNLYDGYQFTVFNHDPFDPNTPSEKSTSSLILDGEGNLWFGTWGGGLNRLDPRILRFSHFRHDPTDSRSISDDRVQTVAWSRTGHVWAGTFSGGLNRLDPRTGRCTRYQNDPDRPDSLSNDRVWAILEDRQGRLWVGTDDGLNLLLNPDRGTFRRFSALSAAADAPRREQVRCLAQDRRGTIWVGTPGALDWINPLTFERGSRPMLAEFSETRPNCIFEDNLGALWIGTSGGGLYRLDQQAGAALHFRHDPRDPATISHNDIRRIAEDGSGNLWLATRGGGITKLDLKPRKFQLLSRLPDDPEASGSANIKAVLESRAGLLWIGSEAGLDRFDRATGAGTRFRHDPRNPDTLSGNRVWALAEDLQGRIWIGTYGDGLNRYDPRDGRFRRYRHNPADPGSLSYDYVKQIVVDQSGQVWIGTDVGLNRYDPERDRFERVLLNLPKAAGSQAYYISAMLRDSAGQLWLGLDQGLIRFDPATRKQRLFRRTPGRTDCLSYDRVLSLGEHPAGIIWVGTATGLNRYDPASGTFRQYLEKDGLTDTFVVGIVPESSGALWLATRSGLVRFTPSTGQFVPFGDVADGLQGEEFNTGACAACADGRLLFGGIHGLNVFDPAAVWQNSQPPRIVLTSFKKFDRPAPLPQAIWEASRIHLSHLDSFISLEFAALDFTNPGRNRYAYMLEGFDRDWIQCGHRRYASYTNLDGGTYTFRVKGTNSDGVWNEKGASLVITVDPPPWKTWPAYLVYLATAILAVGGYVRYRTREQRRELSVRQREIEHLQRLNKLKDEYLAQTAHELQVPLHGLAGIVDSLLGGAAGPLPAPVQANLVLATESARHLARLVENIQDSVRLRHQDIVLDPKPIDIRRLVEVTLALERHPDPSRGPALHNDLPEGLPLVRGDETRLQQVLHHLVENAVKRTPEGAVRVDAALQGDHLEICVTDTGSRLTGEALEAVFNPSGAAPVSTDEAGAAHLGLSIARNLVLLHGGDLWAESLHDQGNKFRFTVPLAQGLAGTGSRNGATVELSAPAAAGPALPSGAPTVERFRILAVDDDPVHLQVMANDLRLQHYQVQPAGDGVQALEALADSGFDLVILDFMMPRLSGYETCLQLRRRFSPFDLPVLMLVNRTQPREIAGAFEAGATDYLAKPYDKAELLTRVRTLLALKQSLQEAIQNARQLESEKQQRLLAENLRDLARALTATLDIGKVYEELIAHLRRSVPCQEAAGLIREKRYFRVLTSGSQSLPESPEGPSPHLPLGFFAEAFRNRKPMALADIRTNAHLSGYARSETHFAQLFVPLFTRQGLAGLIILKRAEASPFTELEVELASSFAGQAGFAIENARLFEEVKLLAITDELTGLYNRRHFFEIANREFLRSHRFERPFCAIMADIDHFKTFNDTYGHAAGDTVLKTVAGLLSRHTRKIDIVGRYGGEEFSIVLPETDRESAFYTAERLRQIVEQAQVSPDGATRVSVTISLGLAMATGAEESLEALLEKADLALYEAKRGGRNQVVVS